MNACIMFNGSDGRHLEVCPNDIKRRRSANAANPDGPSIVELKTGKVLGVVQTMHDIDLRIRFAECWASMAGSIPALRGPLLR